MPRRAFRSAGVALVLLALLTACGDGGGRTTVTVLAAASLTAALEDVEAAIEDADPDLDLVVSSGGSPAIAAQAAEGAPADLLLTADTTSMRRAEEAGVVSGPPVAFATNAVTAAVAADGTVAVDTIDDLADDDVLVALCAPEVPCGSAAAELLDAAGVSLEPASLEPSVTGVVSRLLLGEVDAGIVYRTDVAASDGELVPVGDGPGEGVGVVTYLAATLEDAGADAERVRDFLRSADGRRILADHGFGVDR